MDEELIRDILLYLPDWTTEKQRVPEPRRYAEAFVSDDQSIDFNERKHVKPEEVVQTYYRAKRFVTQYLRRESLPEFPVIYDLTCMWAAGLLEERYRFKSSVTSRLISNAKTELKPFIRRDVVNLNPQRPLHHGGAGLHYLTSNPPPPKPKHKHKPRKKPPKPPVLRVIVFESPRRPRLKITVEYDNGD